MHRLNAQGKTKEEVAAEAAAAAGVVKTEDLGPAAVKAEALEGELDEGGATRLVLSGARAALPGQTRKRAIDVVGKNKISPMDECIYIYIFIYIYIYIR